MKLKYTVITICATLAIVLASCFGMSAIFNGYLNATAVIYEETDNSDALKSVASEGILRCSYPLLGNVFLEAPEQNTEGYSEDCDERQMYKLYLNTLLEAASLVGLDTLLDKPFEENKIYTDNDYSVIDLTVNNGDYRVTAAFRYKIIFGFYIRPTEEPSEKQIKTAVEELEMIVEKDDQLLQEFLKSIEDFGDVSEINFQISYTGSRILNEMMYECDDPDLDAKFSFYDQYHSLYDCYQYGEKHILTDGKDTVLLSSVGSYGIAVYYDAINKKFCGINLICY